jgi:hypothetical protein
MVMGIDKRFKDKYLIRGSLNKGSLKINNKYSTRKGIII